MQATEEMNDIRSMGKYAAEMFDEIIIRHDKDGRGRTNEELTQLITQGIHSVMQKLKLQLFQMKQKHYYMQWKMQLKEVL